MLMRARSGTMRSVGLVIVRSSMLTRPSRIKARAALRLVSPSFDKARSSDTPPCFAGRRRDGGLPVVAKLERDPKIFRAQRLHRVLQFVLRRRADAHLLALDRALHFFLRVFQVLDDVLGGFDRDALLQRDHLLDGTAGGGRDVTAL